MKIVITGCKGRIGGTVLEYVRSQGVDVLGVDAVGIGNFVDYIHADMTDLAQVYDVLHGADAVIHLAAIRDPRLFTAQKTFMTNVGSTYNVRARRWISNISRSTKRIRSARTTNTRSRSRSAKCWPIRSPRITGCRSCRCATPA
jgi:dTDP-4-dehydrorhamnose reductase